MVQQSEEGSKDARAQDGTEKYDRDVVMLEGGDAHVSGVEDDDAMGLDGPLASQAAAVVDAGKVEDDVIILDSSDNEMGGAAQPGTVATSARLDSVHLAAGTPQVSRTEGAQEPLPEGGSALSAVAGLAPKEGQQVVGIGG